MTATWRFYLRYSGEMCFSWTRAPIHPFRGSVIRPVELRQVLVNTACSFFWGNAARRNWGSRTGGKPPGAGGRIGWFCGPVTRFPVLGSET